MHVCELDESMAAQLLAISAEGIWSMVKQYVDAMAECILRAEQDPNSAAGRRLVCHWFSMRSLASPADASAQQSLSSDCSHLLYTRCTCARTGVNPERRCWATVSPGQARLCGCCCTVPGSSGLLLYFPSVAECSHRACATALAQAALHREISQVKAAILLRDFSRMETAQLLGSNLVSAPRPPPEVLRALVRHRGSRQWLPPHALSASTSPQSVAHSLVQCTASCLPPM